MTYTIQQFADYKNVSERWVQQLIVKDNLPSGYKLFEKSKKERYIIKDKVEKPVYKHASKLTAGEVLFINNALVDENYKSPSGKPNISAIARYAEVHKTTVKRFVEGDYKKKDESRADKGKCRILNKKDLKFLKGKFINYYLASAEKIVQQAIWKVEMEHKVKLDGQRCYQWADEVKGVHTIKHFYKRFIAEHTPHMHSDNWGEVINFLDEVMGDVWPIDDPFIPDEVKKAIDEELGKLKASDRKKFVKQRTKAYTAEALVFIDRKSAYPLVVLICPHSVSGADTKKAIMKLLIRRFYTAITQHI